jgi:Tfp pilus assembly PilM family ATPase
MKNKSDKKKKRGPQEILGLDIGKSTVCALRLARAGEDVFRVLATDVLSYGGLAPEGEGKAPDPLTLPARLKTKYAAIGLNSPRAASKLVSFPGAMNEEQEGHLVQALGLDNPDDYRISFKILAEGRGKIESKALVAALPEAEAAVAVRLLPSGTPAPYSLEISDLAALSAFLHGPGADREKAMGVFHFDSEVSTLAFFNKGILALIRRFPVGADSLKNKVMESLGVDENTAQGILADASFDISQAVGEIVTPLAKQAIVSRDFVERRENCRVEAFWLSGPLSQANDVAAEIKNALNIAPQPWNPLEGRDLAEGAVPDQYAGEEWRFAAALGAGLAAFEEL